MTTSETLSEARMPTEHPLRIDSSRQLDGALIEEVNELCDRVETGGEDVLVLHLIASSVDVSPWPGATGEIGIHQISRWERALRRVERLDALTVTVLEGVNRGPALEVLLATDYRIAVAGSILGAPTLHGEPWPGMMIHRLAQQLGVSRARRLCLSGGDLTAEEAQTLGLVDEVTEDVPAALSAIVGAGGSAGSELAVRRRLLLDAASVSFEEALGAHLSACDRSLRRAGAAVGAGS